MLLTTSLHAKRRCGISAGILKNQQNLSVLTYGDKKNTNISIYKHIRRGTTSKMYGICDADFFWAPKTTYRYYNTRWGQYKIPQYWRNQKVKIWAYTITCRNLDARKITCSKWWW